LADFSEVREVAMLQRTDRQSSSRLTRLAAGFALGATLLAALGATTWGEHKDEKPDDRSLLVEARDAGGGMVLFYTKLQLWTDGTLELTRFEPSGRVKARRRAVVGTEELAGYRRGLEESGYFSAPAEAFKVPIVERFLRLGGDHTIWEVEVIRGDGNRFSVSLPEPYLKRFAPELADHAFVRVGWQLIAELSGRWDQAEVVEP
jgi:hypothetical protein